MKYRINSWSFFFASFPRFEIFSIKMTIPESLKTSLIITCMECLNAVIWYMATACCDIIWYVVISYDMAWHDTTHSLTMIVYGNIIVRFIDICRIAILFVMLHHNTYTLISARSAHHAMILSLTKHRQIPCCKLITVMWIGRHPRFHRYLSVFVASEDWWNICILR